MVSITDIGTARQRRNSHTPTLEFRISHDYLHGVLRTTLTIIEHKQLPQAHRCAVSESISLFHISQDMRVVGIILRDIFPLVTERRASNESVTVGRLVRNVYARDILNTPSVTQEENQARRYQRMYPWLKQVEHVTIPQTILDEMLYTKEET